LRRFWRWRDSYDVVTDGVVVGRIFLSPTAPGHCPLMWTSKEHKGRPPAFGYEPTREAAMAAFAKRPAPTLGEAAGTRPSTDEMIDAVEPYRADQDEIDRDNIVQEPRHEQNQNPASEGSERHEVGDGPHHWWGCLLRLSYATREPVVRSHRIRSQACRALSDG
jgi:hypothetical protein